MKSFALLTMIALLGSGCDVSSGKARALQASLDSAQVELAAVQTQIATLQSQLNAANAKITELTPLANKARTLPIRVISFRAPAGTNTVYQLQNLSGTPLAVKIKLSNSTYQYNKTITCVLPAPRPAPPYEIGPADGWPVATGDILEMTSQDYDVMTKTF